MKYSPSLKVKTSHRLRKFECLNNVLQLCSPVEHSEHCVHNKPPEGVMEIQSDVENKAVHTLSQYSHERCVISVVFLISKHKMFLHLPLRCLTVNSPSVYIREKSYASVCLQACCSSVVLCVIPQGSSWRSTLYTLIESKGHPETNTWLWVISQWDARKNKFTHNYNSCDPTHLSDVNINKITIRPTVTWPAAHPKPNHVSVVSTLLYGKYSTAFL